MTSAIDQKSYLQKYLGGPTADKKKKKKKNVKGKGFRIIDDDLDLSKLRPLDGDDLDILNQGEDAPQIAGIIDERPEELRKMDAFQSSSKWRVITQDDGFNSKLRVEEVKRNMKEVEKENEIVFGKMYSDSEDEKKNDSDASPPRRNDSKNSPNTKKKEKHNSDSDFSPPRRKQTKDRNKNYDSDVSPPRKNAKNDRKTNVSNSDNDNSLSRHKNAAESTSKNTNSIDKKSRTDRTDGKRLENQNDSDASPPRRKDDNQYRNRVRKPSRWGDFKDESNDRSKSPKNRTEKRKNSSDRSKKASNDTEKYDNDSDMSPPRKSTRDSPKRNRSPDSEAPRKKKQSQENRKYDKNFDNYRDCSSPKRSKPNNNKYSEQIKKSHDSNKRRYESDSDEAPARKESYKSDDKRNYKKSSKRRDSDSDLSPTKQERSKIYNKRIPNKSNRQDSDSDLSPPRKERNKSGHQSKRKDSDSDLSPPRQERSKTNDKRSGNRSKRQDSDSDLSPPRKERSKNYQERRDDPPPSNKKMEKTLDGKQAGLQDARQLKQENESFRRREEAAFRNMTDEMSGRNAKIVSRKGKRETSEDRQKQKDKAERQKVLDEKYKQWSRGLKQIESQQAAVQDFLHEAAKPLARYKDDRDLEDKLKDVERQGDPMLQYMRERKRERGELGPEKPIYKGSFPPNRFNIRPGYRWDGVDRSNGYENKYFAQQSKRKAQEEEVYKWSTEDL